MNIKNLSPIALIVLLYAFGMFFQRLGSYLTAQFTDNTIYQNLGENFIGVIFVVTAISKLKMWSQIHWFSKEGLTKFYLFILPAAYILLILEIYILTANKN